MAEPTEADIQKACRLLENQLCGQSTDRPEGSPHFDPDRRVEIAFARLAISASIYHHGSRPTRGRRVACRKERLFDRERPPDLGANYMLAADRDTRSSPRIFVAYDDLLSRPEATLDRIATSLSITFPRGTGAAARASAFIAPSQRNQTIDAPWSHRLTEPISRLF